MHTFAAVHTMPVKVASMPPTKGALTRVQALPAKRNAIRRSESWSGNEPTAMQLVVDADETAVRLPSPVVPGDCTAHDVPFPARTSGLPPSSPTAMQCNASTHVTARSSLCGPPGLATAAKLVPFQCSIRARVPVGVSRYPTAVQFDAVTQSIPSNSAGRATCGSGCACAVHVARRTGRRRRRHHCARGAHRDYQRRGDAPISPLPSPSHWPSRRAASARALSSGPASPRQWCALESPL